jgi:hypothetical protein
MDNPFLSAAVVAGSITNAPDNVKIRQHNLRVTDAGFSTLDADKVLPMYQHPESRIQHPVFNRTLTFKHLPI